MKRLTLILLLITSPVLSAQDFTKPFAPDTQIRFLKLQREFQQKQVTAAMLQRQFDQTIAEIGKLQGQLEAECNATAKAANVDLAKFNCDLESLSFVPKSAASPKPSDKK